MSVRDRILTVFRMFLLFTVLVAVAMISAITTVRITIHGHQETMPNLVGRSLEDGQRMASGLGLELKVEGKLFNSKYPQDAIVSQVPSSGTRIKVGQHVHVLVSLGQPQVKVPNVLGDSARAAQIGAIQQGLTVGDVVGVHWPGSEVDDIVAQEPAASSTELHSPALNLLVSLGPPARFYECPSLVGQSVAGARRLVEENGFKVEAVTQVPALGTPQGTILSQSPPAGSKIPADAVFTFEVAGPPLKPVPPSTPAATPAPPAATPAPAANPPGTPSTAPH